MNANKAAAPSVRPPQRPPAARRPSRSAMVSSPEARAKARAEQEEMIRAYLAGGGSTTACPTMPAAGSHFSPSLGTDL